jgi:hypothetical protein
MDQQGNSYFSQRGSTVDPSDPTRTIPHVLLTSLDRSGVVRFQSIAESWTLRYEYGYGSGPVLIGDRSLLFTSVDQDIGTPLKRALHSFSASTGELNWSTGGRGVLASGNGYILDSSSHPFWPDDTHGSDSLAALDPATGAVVGQVSRDWTSGSPGTGLLAVDEAGNFYAYLQNQLWSFRPSGDVRFVLPPGPRGSVLAAAGGIIVESDGLSGGSATRVSRASDGALIVSSRLKLTSAIISGGRFGFVECTGEYSWSCNTAALTMYDLAANRALWRVDLGAVPYGRQIDVFNPVFTSAGLVFLVEQIRPDSGTGPVSSAVRVFDTRGNETIHCALPGGVVYSGANLAGGRFVVWGANEQGQETIWGFDSYGIQPATHGWVSDMGSPQHDRRAR